MRAGIYLRISEDRTGDRAGVDRQLADCTALCDQRGWTVTRVYEDNDRSAWKKDVRPGYGALLADVAEGLLDVAVAWHSDRLWRSVIDQQLFLSEGRAAGLQLVATCSGDVDPANSDDGFLATVLAAVADKESADKSRRVRRKMDDLAQAGVHKGGGMRAFGHNEARDGLVLEEAELVRSAVASVLAGSAVSTIVIDWNEAGITTATGQRWRHGSLSKLLRQPRIAGLRTHRGEIVGPAAWPAIVDRTTWDRLQVVLDARRVRPTGAPTTRSLLGGILRCGKCTKRMSRGGTHYRCQGRSQGGCGGVTIPAWLADEAILTMVFERTGTPEHLAMVARAQGTDAQLGEALEEIAAGEARLATLDQMFTAGEVADRDYREMRRRIADVLDQHRARVLASSPGPVFAGQTLADGWDGLDLAQQRAAILSMVDAVDVAPVGRGSRRGNDPTRLAPSWLS